MVGLDDFYRGDSKVIYLSINNTLFEDGTAWLTFKKDKSDDDVDAVIQKSATIIVDPADATKNVVQFVLTPADTDIDIGLYYYDIQLVNAAGTIVKTILSEKLYCRRDTTVTI